MRRQERRAIPRAWTGLVLAERGVYARWRFRRLTRWGWPPCLRINPGGPFRPTDQGRGVPLQTVGPAPGTTGQGPGIACPGRPRPLHRTRLAWGDAKAEEPGRRLTARPPEARTACGEGGRAGMAQGCKITQRAGWPWHRPPMTPPARAARRWLAVAVAPLWLLSVGGEAEETLPASTGLAVPARVPPPARTRRATRLRLGSILRRGWPLLLVALLAQVPRPMGRCIPEPWPAVLAPEEAPPSLPALILPQAA
jgi:hypothetical protein